MKYFKHISLSVLSLALLFFALNTQAEEPAGWKTDTAHSSVGFTVRHLGISKVNGTFKSFKSNIQADPATGKITQVEGTVEIASIDTGIEARDNHLKAEDFFDAAKFPTATLKTKSITFKGDNLTGVAELTLKGVTKKVTFTGEYLGSTVADFGHGKNRRAGYSVSTTINRRDFGLSFNKLVEGVSVVSDKVTITLEMEIFFPVK